MAGLGRRSHYRKHLTDAVLNDFPEPDIAGGERIAKVVGTRGSNQFEIVLAPLDRRINQDSSRRDNDGGGSAEKEDGLMPSAVAEPVSAAIIGERNVLLAILPTKFRKLVWLKRNDFVIVRCGEEKDDEEKDDTTGSIRYQIEHILYKEQVKHLKKERLWPEDNFFSDLSYKPGNDVSGSEAEAGKTASRLEKQDHDEGSNSYDCSEEEEDEHADDGIVYDAGDDFVNTNRIATLRVEDSESESEEE